MRKISKVDTRSQATAYGGSAVILATPFVLIGAYFALAGFGFLPLPGVLHGRLDAAVPRLPRNAEQDAHPTFRATSPLGTLVP